MHQTSALFLEAVHLNKQAMSGDSQITILKDINLQITHGESIAILGQSGSGKTTLLTLLAGLDVPTTGDIYFQQQHLNRLDEEARAVVRKKSVGFVFQSFQLLPQLTALENVMLPLEIQYVPYQQCKTDATVWLNKLGLGHRLQHYPAKLSGGEQQRVAIARAFINQPAIIFADEMTGNLDIETGRRIADNLFALNEQQKTTLVLVTHDEALAARCARRLLLADGILQAC